MKSSKTCDCSGKSKCIVITIETCCRKSSEGRKPQGNKIRGDGSDKNMKRVTSGPVITERSSSYIQDEEELSPKPSSDSKVKPVASQTEPLNQLLEDDVGDGKAESILRFEDVEPTQHRLFKLPLVTERHHGVGCAMEISVLERHDSTCMYKKEDVEGRNPIDDKSGSYDCIGRLVFRTCNSTETESDSSKSAFHGGSAGEKNVVEVLPPRDERSTIKIKNPEKEPEDLRSTSSKMKNARSKSSTSKKSSRSDKSLKSQQSRQLEASEERVKSKHVVPQHSMLPPKKENKRRHYPGDGCKLHIPKDPMFMAKYIEQGSLCSKDSPVSADIALQTEIRKVDEASEVISSEQIVVSFTDLTKSEEKRKPGFLGAIFRRNYSTAGKPTSADTRR